ncbi:MAG: CorA family divalent cation transporter, partial [Oscillospiraceae bacterium]
PTKQNVRQPDRFFMWIEDNGVVIVDDSGKSKSIIDKIIATKRWKKPSLERFIYDFIEMLVAEDPSFLTELEKLLENLEESVFAGEFNSFNRKLMDCRRMLMIFDGFYSQLLHVVSEFEENENGFFEDDNLYYFRMLASRISQTQSDLRALRDYSREVRELYKAQTDMRENEIMKTFTVVTSVFLPLTLITGWYGMNFEHMPELSWEFGYISVGIMCVAVAVLCIWWFKKKKFF